MFSALKKIFGAASENPQAPMPLPPEEAQAPLMVGMQPVFTAEKAVWGYELLFRTPHSPEAMDRQSSRIDATSSMVSDGFSLIRQDVTRNQRVLINFETEQIIQGLPLLLPTAQIGVEIQHKGPATAELLGSLSLLQAAKCLLILDNYTGDPGQQELLSHVDVVKIPVGSIPKQTLASLVASAGARGIKTVALHVEDHETFMQCRAMGFDLFQGYFISRPLIVRGNIMNTSHVSSMRILNKLADENCTIQEITELLRLDNTITFRLLRFVNSVHHGFTTKISSIDQAVKLIGLNALTQWLPIAVLSKVSTAPEIQYLVWLSAMRGKFLENIALLASKQPQAASHPAPQKLFLLGLFSLLNAIYGISGKDLAEQLSLDDDFVQAFSSLSGPLAPWLDIAVYSEQADWTSLETSMNKLGLNSEIVAKAYGQALEWSRSFYEGSKGSA